MKDVNEDGPGVELLGAGVSGRGKEDIRADHTLSVRERQGRPRFSHAGRSHALLDLVGFFLPEAYHGKGGETFGEDGATGGRAYVPEDLVHEFRSDQGSRVQGERYVGCTDSLLDQGGEDGVVSPLSSFGQQAVDFGEVVVACDTTQAMDLLGQGLPVLLGERDFASLAFEVEGGISSLSEFGADGGDASIEGAIVQRGSADAEAEIHACLGGLDPSVEVEGVAGASRDHRGGGEDTVAIGVIGAGNAEPVPHGLPDGLDRGVSVCDSRLHEGVPEALKGVAPIGSSAQEYITVSRRHEHGEPGADSRGVGSAAGVRSAAYHSRGSPVSVDTDYLIGCEAADLTGASKGRIFEDDGSGGGKVVSDQSHAFPVPRSVLERIGRVDRRGVSNVDVVFVVFEDESDGDRATLGQVNQCLEDVRTIRVGAPTDSV